MIWAFLRPLVWCRFCDGDGYIYGDGYGDGHGDGHGHGDGWGNGAYDGNDIY